MDAHTDHTLVLLVIGVAIFGGTVGAQIFQRLRSPQVVGYIVFGMFIGNTGLGLVDENVAKTLLPFNFLALGLIGFLIGGELNRSSLKKYGKQFIIILLSEGLSAFFLVGFFTGLTAYLFTQDPSLSIALGLLLGAIGSATAPAATVDVLWEYKARGPLTTMVYAIVALDDILALLLFVVASSIASNLIGGESQGFIASLSQTTYELAGSVFLGLIAGILLDFLLRRSQDKEKALGLSLGAITLVVGLSNLFRVDLILAAMTLGITFRNITSQHSKEAFKVVHGFVPPIYALFFVFVGARLNITGVDWWIWAIAATYLLARTTGKMLGASFGARIANCTEAVRKNLGLTLFSQAGVAIGLAILASVRFHDTPLGDNIIAVITLTTFLVQIIGPPCVKLAIQRAGEAGRDITEDDLIHTFSVSDVMDKKPITLDEKTPLPRVLRIVGNTDALTFPVLNDKKRLIGIVTIQNLKHSFALEAETGLFLAHDLMDPVPHTITTSASLPKAIKQMNELGLDYLPVIISAKDKSFAGLIEMRRIKRRLSQELIKRRGDDPMLSLIEEDEYDDGIDAFINEKLIPFSKFIYTKVSHTYTYYVLRIKRHRKVISQNPKTVAKASLTALPMAKPDKDPSAKSLADRRAAADRRAVSDRKVVAEKRAANRRVAADKKKEVAKKTDKKTEKKVTATEKTAATKKTK